LPKKPSKKDILINIARSGGAVIMYSYSTIALYPNGSQKVISSTMYPAKEDKLFSKKKEPKIKKKPFTIKSNEVTI